MKIQEGHKGAQTEECGWHLEAEKNKETDSPPEPPERKTACGHRDFSPVRAHIDFAWKVVSPYTSSYA